jgi:very-short-patch-repair endonuclease
MTPVPAEPAAEDLDRLPSIVSMRATLGEVLRLRGLGADAVLSTFEGALFDPVHPPLSALGRLVLRPASVRELIGQALDGLAETALGLWPDWLPEARSLSPERSAATQAALRLMARSAGNSGPFFGPWLEAAALKALNGEVPRIPELAPQVELRELVRALTASLHRTGFLLVVEADGPEHGFETGLAAALEWLAANGPLAIVLCEPAAGWASQSRFPILDLRVPGRNAVAADTKAETISVSSSDRPAFWLSGVTGRPHPNSQAEQRLAEALYRQEWRGEYGLNRTLDLGPGRRARVDLVWPKERLVVEIDGIWLHAIQQTYEDDRHRDFMLLHAGYLVLRMTSEEVLRDLDRSLEKVRQVLELLRRNPWKMGG